MPLEASTNGKRFFIQYRANLRPFREDLKWGYLLFEFNKNNYITSSSIGETPPMIS